MPHSNSSPLRAAGLRFCAGAAIPISFFVGFSAITHYQVTRQLPDVENSVGLALTFAGLVGGYIATLRRMAPRLRDDAEFGERRGIVAGIAAAGLFITLAPLISVGPLVNALGGVDWTTLRFLFAVAPLPFAVLSGALAAAALFFPWLRSASEQRAHRELVASAPAAAVALPLPGASITNRTVARDADSVTR